MRSLVDVLKAWLDVTRESTWRGNGRFDFAQVIGTHRDFKSQLAVILPARWPNAVIEHQPVGRRWQTTVKLSNFAQRRFEVLVEFVKS